MNNYRSSDESRGSRKHRHYQNYGNAQANDRVRYGEGHRGPDNHPVGSDYGSNPSLSPNQNLDQYNNRYADRPIERSQHFGRFSSDYITDFGMNRDDTYYSNGNWKSDANHFGKAPKNYKRSDSRLKEEVSEALTFDHGIDASDIDVSVKDGIVTLSGSVPERKMKHEAELCAERVYGVIDVKNDLRKDLKIFGRMTEEDQRSTAGEIPPHMTSDVKIDTKDGSKQSKLRPNQM
ncbi:MAG: BON domain-containing protein [Bdellovibrionales bacterium]|nr:BON domain-containing protein [Bdellovibrionales bacterium]